MKDYRKKITKFRPTVVIGLGGTGHDILLKLKKRFIDTFTMVPPNIALLSIDVTEPENANIGVSEGRQISLDPNTERLLIKVTNPSNLIGDMNPHISEWWPESTPVASINDGAGQVRPVGRLAFFAKYEEIVVRIKEVLSSVNNVKTLNEMDSNDWIGTEHHNMEVYIVNSVAGGTGSGLALDIAFNVRQLIDPSSIITGMLILPRIFEKDVGIRQKSNAYAALKEIEFFMKMRSGDSFTINYSGDNPIIIEKPPYDLLYTVDAMNERRHCITDKQLLFSIVAEGIFVQIGSQIGASRDGSLSNIKRQLSSIGNVKSRSVSYCSFGLASLKVDSEKFKLEQESIKIYLAKDICNQMINGNFLQNSPLDKTLHLIYGQIINDNIADFLIEELIKAKSGGLMNYTLRTDYLDIERRGLERDIRSRFEAVNNQMKTEVSSTIQSTFEKMQTEAQEKLSQWQNSTLNQPGGVHYAHMVSDLICAEIDRHQQYLKAKSEDDQKKLQDLETGLPQIVNVMHKAGGVIQFYFRNGRGVLNEAITAYAENVNKSFNLYIRLEGKKKVIELLEAIKSQIGSIKKQCVEIEKVMLAAGNTLDINPSIQSSNGNDSNPFERLLPIDTEILKGIQQKIRLEDFIKSYRTTHSSVLTIAQKQSKDMAKIVLNFVEDNFSGVQENGIEALLSAVNKDQLPMMLKRLNAIASPLWCYDESKLPLPHKTIFETSCYGVHDAETTFLKKIEDKLAPGQSAPSFISLMDPYRITLFKVRAGVPLFALDGIKEMEHSYSKLQDIESSHLDKRWVSFPELTPLFPLQKRTSYTTRRIVSRLWFELALAPLPFKLIEEMETGYKLSKDKNEEKEAEELGSTYTEAFDKFDGTLEMVQYVEAKVREIVCSQNEQTILNSLKKRQTVLIDLYRNKINDFQMAGHIETAVRIVDEIIDGFESFIKEMRRGGKV